MHASPALKKAGEWTVYAIIALAMLIGIALVASCATGFPAFAKSDAAATALQDNLAAIQEDGIVTPEEWAGHGQLAEAYYAALREDAEAAGEGVDWQTLVPTALGSVLASFLGVNAYRNNREVKVWGAPPPHA